MPRKLDLTGQSFGQLIVTCKAASRLIGGTKRAYWNCKCACGNSVEVLAHSLTRQNKNTTHCGCLNIRGKAQRKVHPGEQYGFLKVLQRLGPRKPNGPHYLKCQCICGKITETTVAALRNKKRPIRSCGCINKSSDSYESFVEDDALANSKCFVYLVEVANVVDKIGITVNPDCRKYSGKWSQVWWKKQLTRAECWAVETVALFLTQEYKPTDPYIIYESCGASEQRTGWVLDDVITLLEELIASCQSLGWQAFYHKHLCPN
jgi:hypothetical protein